MAKQLPCGRKRSALMSESDSKNSEWRSILGNFLKKEGLRLTEQREKIAKIALGKKTHFEIQELVKEVRREHSDISPATVYRNVKTLCEAGLLHETLESRSGVTLYEQSDGGHHDHIVCLDCGEIFEFHNAAIEKAQEKAVADLGFREIRHQHVIYAHCEDFKKS